MRLEAILPVLLTIAVALAGSGCATGQTGKPRNERQTQQREAASANTQLGQSYLQRGQYEMALEKLQRALQLDPGFVDAHTVIAVLYETIGDTRQAEQHYKRASHLKPRGGAEANNYGAFLCKLNRADDAESYFQRALADPFYQTPEVALINAGTCFAASRKYDAAERHLRMALERRPDNVDALFQMAAVQYQKGDFLKARAFMQRLDSVGASRPEALLLGRSIELKLGNPVGAGEYAHRLQQEHPKSQEARSLGSSSSGSP